MWKGNKNLNIRSIWHCTEALHRSESFRILGTVSKGFHLMMEELGINQNSPSLHESYLLGTKKKLRIVLYKPR